MRGRFVVAVLATAIVTAVVTPAHASSASDWPLDCTEGMPSRPPQSTVWIDDEGLHVDGGSAWEDVAALVLYADATVWHLARCEGAPTAPVGCLLAVVDQLDTYYSIRGTQVNVYYPALISDLRACAGV